MERRRRAGKKFAINKMLANYQQVLTVVKVDGLIR
jgi:hypothetical protein